MLKTYRVTAVYYDTNKCLKVSVIGWSSSTPRVHLRMCNFILLHFFHSALSQSDSCGEKENPLSQNLSSSQPPARFTCNDSGGELTISTYTAAAASPFREDDQTAAGDLGADLSPTTQRDEGEGWDREQAKRLEERNKWFEEGVPLSEMSSRWDSMELKRGSVPVPVTETIDSELNRKWAEFETLSFSEMSPQSLIGAQVYPSDTQQQSIDLSRTHHRNSEEAEQSEASLTRKSEGNPQFENGVQIPTAETLQKEVSWPLNDAPNLTQDPTLHLCPLHPNQSPRPSPSDSKWTASRGSVQL